MTLSQRQQEVSANSKQAKHTDQSRRKWAVTVTDETPPPSNTQCPPRRHSEFGVKARNQYENHAAARSGGHRGHMWQNPTSVHSPPPASLLSIPVEPLREPVVGAGVWRWRRQKSQGGRLAHLEPRATRRPLNSRLLHELCRTSPDHGGISEP